MTEERKIYTVDVHRYPVEIEVEATSAEEAKELAKDKVDFSVYETEVTNECSIEEEVVSCSCCGK